MEDEELSEDDERLEDTVIVPGDTLEGSVKVPSTNNDGGAVYPLYPGMSWPNGHGIGLAIV